MIPTSEAPEVLSGLRAILNRMPQYRLGQLVCSLASSVGNTGLTMPWQVSDDELRKAIQGTLDELAGQDFRQPAETDPAVRESLLSSLELLAARAAGTHIGMLVSHLAFSGLGIGPASVWDAEDQDLFNVARQELSRPQRRLSCTESDFTLPDEADALHAIAN